MQIVAYCPECRSRYQLHDELRGRRMRCPNNACRSIFTVVEAAEPAPQGDNPIEVVDWRAAPPPVQHANGPAIESEPRRRKDKRDKYPIAKAAPLTPIAAAASPSPPLFGDLPPSRRGLWPVVLLLMIVAGLFGGGAWLIVTRIARSEENLRTQAESDYKAGSFRSAVKKYEELAVKFGRGGRSIEYYFLAELASVRDLAARMPPEPLAASELASTFVQRYARDPLLKAWRDDLASALGTNANGLIAQAQSAVDSEVNLDSVPALIQSATSAVGLVERFPTAGIDPAALSAKIEAIGDKLNSVHDRQANVSQIVALLKPPKVDLDGARAMIRRHHLERDPAVAAALAEAELLAREVKYEPLHRPAQPTAPPETVPSMLLEPPAVPAAGGAADTVFAVARGLLFAFDSRTGKRLWVARVGLDASGLPLRIPARGDEPELVLVAGAEPPSLTARDVRTGAVRWHQPLDAPILGRPVVAGPRLFAATVGSAGLVYELDPRDGLLRGRFAAGQAFAAGAAFDAATGRLYVPTHGQYVYVFNFTPSAAVAGPGGPTMPICEGLLPTGHAPGSLRGEPIVVSGEAGVDVPRYLVLGEADGIEAMKLRAFRLLDKPTTVGPTADVRWPGWSWFAPYHDAEKLVLVTDAGALGLVGIQQKGTTDAPLFPLLGRDAPPIETARSAARAELVHAEEYGFWALAAGRLQHWRLGLDRRLGPKLTPAWSSSLAIGSPLHASQVSRDHTTLYLVTQTSSPSGHWATAVDARTSRERWRRPLGLTCQGDPIPLADAVLALDPSGAVDSFDQSAAVEGPWTAAGRRLFPEIKDLVNEPQLSRSPDGRQVVVVACKTDGPAVQLILRQVGADGEQQERTIALPAVLAGPPAVGATAIVLPLADGSLARVPLTGESRRDIGPNWRAIGGRPDSRSHVLAWRGDEFLVFDGSRRLMRLRWPDGTQYELETAQAIELPGRMTGAPVRLGDTGESPTALVADSSGSVHLLRGPAPRIERTWRPVNTGEQITAGPWVIADRAYVVVADKKLVALDPSQETSLWTYASPGDGITYAPTLIDGKLVVADQAGSFMLLDPATGVALGPGFRHPAEVAPTAGPVAFGNGRFFAPLTDGSILVMPVTELLAR